MSHIVPKGKLTEGSVNLAWGTHKDRFATSTATSYGAAPTIQRVLATSNSKPASLFPDTLWDTKATSTTKTSFSAPDSQAVNGADIYAPTKRKLPVRPNNYPHDPNNKHGTGWSTSQRSDYNAGNAMAFAHPAGAPPTVLLQQGDRRKFDTGFATTNFQTSYVALPYSKAEPAAALYNNNKQGGFSRSTDRVAGAYSTSSEIANRQTVDVSDYSQRPPPKKVMAYLRTKSSLPQGTVDGSGIHMEPVSTTALSATIKANSYPLVPPVGNDGSNQVSNVDNHNAFRAMPLPSRRTHTTAGASYAGSQTTHAHVHVPVVTKKDVLLACDPFQGAIISSTKAHYLGLDNGGRVPPALDKNQKWEHHAKAGDAVVRMATSVGVEYTGPVQARRAEIRPPPVVNIAPWHEPQEIRPVGAVTATSGEAFSTPQVELGDKPLLIDLRSSSIQMPRGEANYSTTAQDLQWPEMQRARASMPSQQISTVLLRNSSPSRSTALLTPYSNIVRMSMIGADSSAVMHKAVLKKQYGMVSPPSGTSAPSCLQLGPLDGFNLRLWFLESTHFFQESLDTDAIKSSLEQLLARYPSFAGRAKKRTARRQKGKGEVEGEVAADHKNIWKGYQVVVDENCGVPLVEIELPGTAADAANDPALWHSRGLASIPSLPDVINGAAETTTKTSPPLMTVVVTQFSGGGSALGVAVNHGLVDGKGYAELLKTWSLGHRLGWDHADVAKLQVARPQFLLQSSCAPASDDVVFDTRTQAECDTFCRVTEPTIWRSAGQARARIYFTWAELRDFKANTACYEREIKPACPTSTEALAARVWCAFFERVLRSAAPTDRAIQPQLMTQMRCPRNPQIPSNFLGNCVEGLYSPLIQVDSNTKTLQPDLRTLLCTGFRAAGALMEDDASKHVMITKLSQKISNILAGFWGSSAAGSKKMQGAGKHDDSNRIDLFGVNAMQSFRVFGLNFGLNDSVGYIPHNLGCPFQIEEASGGVYVLLQVPPWAKSSAPSDWLEQVESLAFRDSVSSI